MKKFNIIMIILIVLSSIAIILSLILRNKGNIEVNYTKDINFTSNKQVLAITHLMDIEEINSKYIDKFGNIKVYQVNGNENYLVIPRYSKTEINIYEYVQEEDNFKKGDLITSTKLPFVITCNENDISNVIFEIKYNDKVFEYSPSINKIDNTLNTNEYVFDMTK